MLSKLCTKCHTDIPISLFRKRKSSKDGYRSECKQCQTILGKIRYENNKESILSKQRQRYKILRQDPLFIDKVNAYGKMHFKSNPIIYILSRCKSRAKKFGLEFNIDKSDIVIPDYCPILKIPIIKGEKVPTSNSPSVDRIDNTKGYVKGNIQIISQLANAMKSSASPEQLLLFAKWINKNY